MTQHDDRDHPAPDEFVDTSCGWQVEPLAKFFLG